MSIVHERYDGVLSGTGLKCPFIVFNCMVSIGDAGIKNLSKGV